MTLLRDAQPRRLPLIVVRAGRSTPDINGDSIRCRADRRAWLASALERIPGCRIDRVNALPPWHDARAADADTDANARPPDGGPAVSQGEERPC